MLCPVADMTGSGFRWACPDVDKLFNPVTWPYLDQDPVLTTCFPYPGSCIFLMSPACRTNLAVLPPFTYVQFFSSCLTRQPNALARGTAPVT